MGKYTSIPGTNGIASAGGASPLADADLETNFPALWEFLTLTEEDGDRRVTATLLVFVQDGRMTLCLNDRHTDRTAFVSGPTLREAMVSLEEGLAAGCVEWRQRRQPNRSPTRK